jgi:hypothetical protein
MSLIPLDYPPYRTWELTERQSAQVDANVPYKLCKMGTKMVQIIDLPDGTVLHKTGNLVEVNWRGRNYDKSIQELKFIIESKGRTYGYPTEEEWAASNALYEKSNALFYMKR